MQLDNHMIPGGLYKLTPNAYGNFASPPSLIVMHYTAGGAGKVAAEWLCNPQAQASAHIVVDRDGSMMQLLPFNRMAWHAGASQWNGRQGCNSFSIGIEISNYGFLTKQPDGNYKTAYGDPMPASKAIDARHKNGYFAGWEKYAPAQLDAVEELTKALLATYPSLTDIAGHDDIAPNIKVDPGPAFPMDRFKALLGDRPKPVPVHQNALGNLYRVDASVLNVRQEPNGGIIGAVKFGDSLAVVEVQGDWTKVLYNGKPGYVWSAYIHRSAS